MSITCKNHLEILILWWKSNVALLERGTPVMHHSLLAHAFRLLRSDKKVKEKAKQKKKKGREKIQKAGDFDRRHVQSGQLSRVTNGTSCYFSQARFALLLQRYTESVQYTVNTPGAAATILSRI